MKKKEIYFFRSGVDLKNLVYDEKTGYLNEVLEISGLGKCIVIGTKSWTGIKPVQPKKTTTRK